MLAVCREYLNGIIILFPEVPGSRKPRECLAFCDKTGFTSVDYEYVISRSKPSKPKRYRDLVHQLKKQSYSINVIQQASPVMHDRRKLAAETFVSKSSDEQ